MSDPAPTDSEAVQFLMSSGMRFPLEKQLLPRKVRMLLRRNGYEAKEALAAQRLVKRGDIVMELGGGVGFMSTLISTKTKATAIHTFEANPRLIPYIQRVHEANNVRNVQVHHAVLGDGSGTETFYVRKSILDSSLAPLPEDDENVVQTSVPRLDTNEMIAQIKPTVLVCDIEGAEADLLPTMDLSSLRAVLIELHPQWIGKEGISRVFDAFAAAGLVFFPRWSHGKVAVFRSDW